MVYHELISSHVQVATSSYSEARQQHTANKACLHLRHVAYSPKKDFVVIPMLA